MSSPDFDVLIAGGGLTGLALAARLTQQTRLTVAVAESRPPVDAADELDLRVSALSPASLAWLAESGAWPVAESRYCAYHDMVIWQGDRSDADRSLRFSAAEAGVPELGCIVENLALRRVLWAQLERETHCTLIVDSLDLISADDASMRLQGRADAITARLLVAADGAASRLRQRLGVGQRERSYGQNALVAHLAAERPHGRTALQKFLPGGPLALLPLPDGRVSLVWSHPQTETEELLALDDEGFARRVTDASDAALGTLRCTTPRASFPLTRAHAMEYTGRRFALLGDAAHRVHPLAGQGANLGLQDAAVLADELGAHMTSRFADPGDPAVLRRYERRRKGDNALMLGAMDALDAAFRSSLAATAGRGMGIVDSLAVIKSRLAGHAMGIVPR